jgi:phosphoribosylformylglycinamidine cyclo-ligase
VAEAEMHRVFNCGIGMAIVVAASDAGAALAQLRGAGESAYRIGSIRERRAGEAQTLVA